MIGRLRGTLVSKHAPWILLDVAGVDWNGRTAQQVDGVSFAPALRGQQVELAHHDPVERESSVAVTLKVRLAVSPAPRNCTALFAAE